MTGVQNKDMVGNGTVNSKNLIQRGDEHEIVEGDLSQVRPKTPEAKREVNEAFEKTLVSVRLRCDP
jgi:hypothetical protein